METKRQIKTPKLKEINVDGLDINELKALLRSGDHKLIGEITGLSQDYVGKVFDTTRKSELVIEVARMLLKNRQFVTERAALLKKQYELKRSNNGI